MSRMYESPQVEVIEVMVEAGFSSSIGDWEKGGSGSGTLNPVL